MPNRLPWGFHRLEDVADQSVTDPNQAPAVRDAINEFLQAQTQLTREVFGLFVDVTTDAQSRYKMPSTIMELQPGTELGRALPQRYAELEYSVGFPIQKGQLALGETYEQRVKMSIRQFAGLMQAVGVADTRWMRRHALAALFYNGAGWVFEDPDFGDLTIKGLANGDSQVYAKEDIDLGATDNHYLAQAGDLVSASDPIPGIIDELVEHPQNQGDVVILGSKQDRAKYAALNAFHPEPDPNLTVAAGAVEFQGNAPGGIPGQFLGYHDSGAYIYLWRGIPQNYMIGITTGGDKVLRQREHPEAPLRGFKADAEREDFPYLETQYSRRAGFGAFDRVGAVVQRFGNAAYAIPAGYESPLA